MVQPRQLWGETGCHASDGMPAVRAVSHCRATEVCDTASDTMSPEGVRTHTLTLSHTHTHPHTHTDTLTH